MDWLVKLIFGLMLLPFFVSLVLHVLGIIGQMMLASLVAVLPWIIGLALLIGIIAGVSAGLVMRRRGLPRNRGGQLPPGVRRIRRPREIRRRNEDE